MLGMKAEHRLCDPSTCARKGEEDFCAISIGNDISVVAKQLTVSQTYCKRGRCGAVECQVACTSSKNFKWRYWCTPLSYIDVRLCKILMVVVDMMGQFSIKLFSSCMPRYTKFDCMENNIKWTQNETYSEMCGWTNTYTCAEVLIRDD